MADSSSQPNTIYLSDYQPPDFMIDSVVLDFELDEADTRVQARLRLRRGPHAQGRPLVLNGHDLELVSLRLDDQLLASGAYRVDDGSLTLTAVPDSFTLDIETLIHPDRNTSLGGLYTSGGNFCTQCEAEDFRKITYFLDRPDVMARYTTTLHADRARYPVLLSNGNLIARGEDDDNRHWATWEDPFPKPSYLFALVAGDLTCIEDRFTTRSGREVTLRIFVQHHNADKCEHAMRSLKNAMAWDERVYGREYDLDLYMIVAVDDFNMGAMENKGLNIFNSRYVLARPDTATDQDYQGIEGVIGHEYFHNWSGNRVTCRDWFQLSLKEGFTVYRDEEFSADMGSRGVKRIEDVNILRSHQFREDAGPMAHPVRPDAYAEINNFYTVTVYNKGAEVVRMLAHLVGEAGFRRGTDLYFQRHDGQAVTTDDFVRAIEDANQRDFSQFRRWYDQAGTPVLSVTQDYDETSLTYTLTVRQTCPPTPGQPHKQPFHIPLAMGLLNHNGQDMQARLADTGAAVSGTFVLDITEAKQVFEFHEVEQRPVPSLLRGFSAPVKLETDLGDGDYYFLMAHDSDPFNRWEAGQQMAIRIILDLVSRLQAGQTPAVDPAFISAMDKTLHDEQLDKAMIAAVLTLPSEAYLGEFMPVIDPDAIHQARRFLYRRMAEVMQVELRSQYLVNQHPGAYEIDAASIGRRALRNTCLRYLMELDNDEARRLCVMQFDTANNMTDVMAALECLANSEGPERQSALTAFYEKWRDDALVVDKWLRLQATSYLPDTLPQVRALTAHPAFNLRNPNKVRSLIGAFSANPVAFHARDGSGYVFLSEYIMQLDERNPQLAARLCNPFTQWRRYDAARQALMKAELERLQALPALSRDVAELVGKSLAE